MYLKLLLIIIILTQVSLGNSFLNSKLKDLKNKAKDIYDSKFGKNKKWHFLGHDLTIYPGIKQEYRAINHKKWNEYYKCLETLANNLAEHGAATPEAVLGFPGDFIKFKCNICLSPKEQNKMDSVDWYWAHQTDQHYQQIIYDESIILTPEDKSLHIYNLQQENTGQYMCKMSDSLTTPYFLTVINKTTKIASVHDTRSKKGPYALSHTIEGNFELSTKWNNWTPCSSCNVAGRKYKLGYCQVKYINNTFLSKSSSADNSTINSKSTENVEKQNDDLKILQLILNGIPCRSHILPKSISNLNLIKNRPEEVMIGYCKVKCRENKIFEVRDEHGNVIEKVNNSQGIYSMTQPLPPVEPSVERRLMYGVKGNDLAISCPGNLNSDEPIKWQMGSKRMVPEMVSAESNGRIYITITGRIVIHKSKVSDSNIFSCWQNNELAGTVKVIIEKKFQMQFNHHIMLFGLIIIVSTFLLVFIKAFTKRKYAKIK